MKRVVKWLCTLGLLACLPAVGAERPTDSVMREMEVLDKSGQPPLDKLNALFELAWQYALLDMPELGTYTGAPGLNHRWTDMSAEAVRLRKKDMEFMIRMLSGIDVSESQEADRLNYDLFKRFIQTNLESTRFPGEYLPVNQMGGPQLDLAQIFAMMPLRNAEDVANYLSRFRGIPQVLNQAQAWMEKGLAVGVTPPKITLRNVSSQILSQIPENAEQSPLLMPLFANKGKAFVGDAIHEAEKLYQDEIRPAFLSFHGFFEKQYFVGARETIGQSELPNGKAWYQFNIRKNTTTNMTAEEIHQIGMAEVKRIRAEMDTLIKASGFEGDFAAFTEFLRTDPQFFFSKEEDLLAAYRNIAKLADAQLVKLFGVLPRLPYGVIEVPEYQEKTATTAYYNPGSVQVGRPGYFFANTYDLKSRPKWEMEALTLHEAVPGHHLQIALAQELENVPRFRTFSTTTAFVEGWGLYSESLGEEMGFYKDPYSKFGQLTYEMWRAIRLVVDSGMHALGWSREKAIDFFKENTGKAEHDILVEVDRYIVWPGQALAYKIGELKIKELKAYSQKELGQGFDIRKFHDRVLGAGAIPLEVLEQRIKSWVADQKSGAK